MKKYSFSVLIAAVLLAAFFAGAVAQPLAESPFPPAPLGQAGGETPARQSTPETPLPAVTPLPSPPSPVGRNVQLVVGAALLVLIVIGGVAWASAQEAKRH